MEEQTRKLLSERLAEKIQKYGRVLAITRKPDREEYSVAAKVTGAGILLIGAIGFTVYLMALFAGLL